MFRIVVPLVVGHMFVSKCPPADQTREPVRNSIRRLMWPMLLISMGFAWYVASKKSGRVITPPVDAAFSALLAVLIWWLHTLFCKDNPAQARLILLLVAAATGIVTYISGMYNPLASVVLLPMVVWLLFAERLQLPRIRLPSIRLSLTATPPTA